MRPTVFDYLKTTSQHYLQTPVKTAYPTRATKLLLDL